VVLDILRYPVALAAIAAIMLGAGCGGANELTTASSSPPVDVAAHDVLRGGPYMGIACASRDALSCDRVGVFVRLTRPAHAVIATLGGREFALDDPDFGGRLRNGVARRFAGYLKPAGLREPGPLHVLGQPQPGRDRWLDSAPNKFPVTLAIERKDGTMQTTRVDVWLAPGWG
jgi:hypothetical protein